MSPSTRRLIRILALPAVVIVVGFAMSRYAASKRVAQCDRVRAELAVVVDALAKAPNESVGLLPTSERIVVDEFARRLRAAGMEGPTEIVVEPGDSAKESDGTASHTVTVWFGGAPSVGLRIRVDSEDRPIVLIGVFAPEATLSGAVESLP